MPRSRRRRSLPWSRPCSPTSRGEWFRAATTSSSAVFSPEEPRPRGRPAGGSRHRTAGPDLAGMAAHRRGAVGSRPRPRQGEDRHPLRRGRQEDARLRRREPGLAAVASPAAAGARPRRGLAGSSDRTQAAARPPGDVTVGVPLGGTSRREEIAVLPPSSGTGSSSAAATSRGWASRARIRSRAAGSTAARPRSAPPTSPALGARVP